MTIKIAFLAGGVGSPVALALETALRKFLVPFEPADSFEADVVIVSTADEFRRHIRRGQRVAYYANSSGDKPPLREILAAGGRAKAFSIDGRDADILPLVSFIETGGRRLVRARSKPQFEDSVEAVHTSPTGRMSRTTIKIAFLAGGVGSPVALALETVLRKFLVPFEPADSFEADVVIVSTADEFRRHIRCGQRVAYYAHDPEDKPPLREILAAGRRAKAFSILGRDADILPLLAFIGTDPTDVPPA